MSLATHTRRAAIPWHERALIRQMALRGFPNWLLAQRFDCSPKTVSAVVNGQRIDRAPRTPDWRREYAADRRLVLVSAGLCLNGGHHGEATHGVRCEDCYWTHRRVA